MKNIWKEVPKPIIWMIAGLWVVGIICIVGIFAGA